MTPRQASAAIGELLDDVDNTKRTLDALIVAKQAFDILATLEENINLNEAVTIENREFEWRVTRAQRTWLGSDPIDAFGQMCTTLEFERGLDGDSL